MNNEFALPPRSKKPRTRGLTSMIDFGPDTFGWTGGEHGIRGLLECAADYIDFAKIYAMNALLLPEQTVARAARAYRDADIVPFAGGKASGKYEEFATGFTGQPTVKAPTEARHRPMGVAVGADGALYISDDVKGRIWRVTATGRQ